MSSKVLVLLVLGISLSLVVLLAWPDRDARRVLTIADRGAATQELLDPANLAQPERSEERKLEPAPPEFSAAIPRDPETEPDSPSAPQIVRVIHARLLDEAGEPIAGGTLRCPLFRVEASSSVDGRVTLELESPEARTPSRGGLELEVAVQGFATLKSEIRVGDPLEQWLGDLSLRRAVPIEGVVLDSLGAPVEGAVVVGTNRTVISGEAARLYAQIYGPFGSRATLQQMKSAPHTAISDREGRFQITDFFNAWAAVYAYKDSPPWTFVSPIAITAGQERVEVQLVLEDQTEQLWIRGRVESSGGEALPDVLVVLTHQDDEGNTQFRRVTSDQSGAFGARVDSGTTWKVSAEPNVWERDAALRSGVSAGTENVVLILPDTKWLWAKVYDEAGVPQTEGQVYANSATSFESHHGSGFPRGRIISDLWDDGRARLRISEQRIYVIARVEGFEELALGPFAPGWSEPVEFHLKRKPMIRGTVFAMGEPLEGAAVSLHPYSPRGREYYSGGWLGAGEPPAFDADSRSTTACESRSAGQFQLALPRQHKNTESILWLVRAHSAEYASFESGPFATHELNDLQALALHLTTGGSIRGVLELPGEESCEGWTVAAISSTGEFITHPVGSESEFVFVSLRPDDWQLRAFKPGVSSWHMARTRERSRREYEVTVRDGQLSLSNLEVSETVPAVLHGRLKLVGVEPAPWRGLLFTEDMRRVDFTTDSEGRFEVEATSPGEWSLELRARDYGKHRFLIKDVLQLAAGSNRWEQEFELATVHVPEPSAEQVLDSSGRTLEGRGEGQCKAIQTVWFSENSESHSFQFPAGKCRWLEFETPNWPLPPNPNFTPQEFELEPGGEVTLEVFP